MPSFDIVKQIESKNSFRVASICGMFDLQTRKIIERFKGNIEIEDKKWNIGVIYGASGTGKTSIAKDIFKNEYIKEFVYGDESIVEEMPKYCETKEIVKMFSSIGFASPPSWLKPYSVLSMGERMRVDLARSILEKRDLIVFDEYTSTINREVAKFGSAALQKAIRKQDKKFVAVTCHYDVLEWLEPDWVFCTDDMKFFFVQENTKGLKLKSMFMNAKQKYGNCLGNITI